MTSKDLLLQLCVHEVQLSQHASNLDRVKQFFNGTDLWPDQCEYAIEVFANILKPIHSLNELLDASAISSSDIAMNRYTLLVQSHYLEQGLRDLVSRLKKYRGLSQSSLKNEHPEYQEMLCELENLWKSYKLLSESVEKIIANSWPSTSYVS